jgi:hypothetical protein
MEAEKVYQTPRTRTKENAGILRYAQNDNFCGDSLRMTTVVVIRSE